MAVTAFIKRNHGTYNTTTSEEFCTATLSGTYVPGGFTVNPFTVAGGLGSAPFDGQTFLAADWYSPLGYTYVSTVAGNVMTTKIFSAPNTELGAVAVPDASLPVILTKRKV